MGNSGSGLDALIGAGVEKLKEEVYLLEQEKAALYADINLKKELPIFREEREKLLKEIGDLRLEAHEKAEGIAVEVARVAEISTKQIRQANDGANANLKETYKKIKEATSIETDTYAAIADFKNELVSLEKKIEDAQKKYETEKLEHAREIFTANKKIETKEAKVKAQEADVKEANRHSLEQEANVTAYAKDKDKVLSARDSEVKAKEQELNSIREKLDKDLSKLATKTETDKEASARVKLLQEREGEKLVHDKEALEVYDADLTKRATKVRKGEESLKLNQEALLSAKKKFEDEKRRFLASR